MNVIAAFLVRFRFPLAVAAFLAVVICWPLSNRLQMDRRLENMLLSNDPDVMGYVALQQQFAASDVVLMIYRDEQIWDPSGKGIARMESIGKQLKEVAGVQAILSLAELNGVLRTLRGANWLQKSEQPAILDPDDPLAKSFREMFSGYTHREGSPFAAIACMLEPSATAEVDRDQTLVNIQTIAHSLPDQLPHGELLGEPVMVRDGFAMLESDGQRLGVTASIILAVVLLILFRSIRWMLIPLIVVHWSLIVTRGLLVVFGGELSMVSSMLTSIVTVVGVATVIHLLLDFQQQLRTQDAAAAMRVTLGNMFSPILWSILTTAVGFASLVLARVGPVQDFGWIMSLAVMVVGGATFLLVPWLALVGSTDIRPWEIPGDRWLRDACERVFEISIRHRAVAIGLIVLITLIAIVGNSKLQVETDFIKSFHPDNPLVQAYETVEENLGGAGVWDIVLPAPKNLTSSYVQQIEELENRLRKIAVSRDAVSRDESSGDIMQENGGPPEETIRLTKVISVADAIAAASSDSVLAFLPVTAKLAGMQQTMPEFTAAMLTSSQGEDGLRRLRIMLRSPESVSSSAKSKLIEQVRLTLNEFLARPEWKKSFGDAEPPPSYITGYYLLLAKLVESLLADQWRCFIAATLMIGAMLWWALGSWKLALASLVPNLLPIFLVWGAMGWLGIKVDMGAVMIAAVSVGLSIDGSIHYLMRAARKEESEPILNVSENGLPAVGRAKISEHQLREAQRSTGLALLVATLALVLGFLSLSVSEFRPTQTFGILTSLTMLGGLVGNLVILPILVAPKQMSKFPEK
jgi:predicted RND superfamily exporter protein